MKIIISGGTGFVGSALTKKLLSLGHDVHTISRSSPPSERRTKGHIHHIVDLTKDTLPKSLFEGTEICFHIAAKAGIWGPYCEFYDANVIATKKILEACQFYNISKFIYTSTPSVVFSGKPISKGTESLAYGKTDYSAYAKTKSIAEKNVLQANSPEEIQTIALRPHLIWGEGDPHLLPRVIKRHKAGKLKLIGDGQNRVDLTHIDNVTHAHICAMEALLNNKYLGGNPYFIGQSEPVFLWKWLDELFTKLGLPVIRKSMNFNAAFLLGSGMEYLWHLLNFKNEPPMTRFIACQLAHDHWFSNRKAEKDLGYKPIKNMEKSLEDSLSWLQSL